MADTTGRLDPSFESHNPATGGFIEAFQGHSEAQALGVLDEVHAASLRWRRTSFADRSMVVHAIAQKLGSRREELARFITQEMGKPIGQARAEIDKCISGCDYFADVSPQMLAPMPTPSDSPNSFVTFEPLGVILAVMPWNFPFWQVFRHAAPALMSGNTILLKHAPNVGRCAIEIERIILESAQEAVCGNVFVQPPLDFLISDDRVAGVTLTGSARAGREVGSLAGRYLKPSVLELGGSDAFIILPDADVEQAVHVGATSRFQNAGQSCIAAKRIIAVGEIAKEVQDRFIQVAASLKVGDPLVEDTDIGPLAREDLRAALHRQVSSSATMGSRVLAGGEPMSGPGYFYPPTVMTDVTADMPVMREETFGPVAVLVTAADEDEAIAIANDSSFGLGGNIWTRDIDKAIAISERLRTGGVFINGMTHSDPRIPFGGIKGSGYGRELSEWGVRNFTNAKTVWRP